MRIASSPRVSGGVWGFLLVGVLLLSVANASSSSASTAKNNKPSLANRNHLRTNKKNAPNTAKYLQCPITKYACNNDDNNSHGEHVNVCRYDASKQTYHTECVASRSNLVPHHHPDHEYCGSCRVPITGPLAFKTTQELRGAVATYLDSPPSSLSYKQVVEQYGWPMNAWNVGRISNFQGLFAKRPDFQEDLSDWDMSSATNLKQLFYHCHSFNSDLSRWNVSRVQSLEDTFFGAEQFDSDLSAWQTSSVKSLEGTFWRAIRFNSPLSNWNTTAVTTMRRTFSDALAFDQDLSLWDTSRVTDMSFMFHQALAYQHSTTSQWDISSVTSFQGMFSQVPFYGESRERQDQLLEAWNLTKTTTSVNTKNMFTAPRPLSLRAQQMHHLGADLNTLVRLSMQQAQHNATGEHFVNSEDDEEDTFAPRDEEEDPRRRQHQQYPSSKHHQKLEEMGDEIKCHGGTCM